MKNKVSESGDSIFKKKGFFVALYSCLGAVMVLALVISFSNLTASPDKSGASLPPDNQQETVKANTGDPENYPPQEQAWKTPKPKVTATPKPSATPNMATARPSAPAVTVTPHAPAVTAPPAGTPPAATSGPAPETDTPDTAPAPDDAANVQVEVVETAASNEAAFTPFSADDKMIWPVSGEVAMVFSVDKLVYDPTLDQYRTNDDLRISAQEGTPVKAGAEGRVVEIDKNNVYGNYVVVDNGNGWTTTYGQLMDGILVKEGEILKAGQVIGGVGQPSFYGSLNGSHVNLRITKENEPVDPRTVLADTQS